ncbi:extracellular solute-binding protein [Spongiactinospora sp. TRM90649]|uniref:extracellular solute-binding protein n=1 Tax=Spongiactinospora sp. TRM90649 TaxID=3031114 RepID=UPI0023F7117E|nr:extracellular solute-binding protein [Spongiactinospora sp. TRM90649]MDF5753704.1 extracellular solute-binding protein [Spongiactinospora sp. TRM90649]
MRKLAAAGLAAALGVTLAGCGSGSGSGSDKSTVTLWMYPVIDDQAKSKAFWDKVEKDFEAANPTVDVKVDLQPWEGRQEKVTTALASKKGFDLVVLGPDQIPQYAQQGTIEPVDDVVAADKAVFRPAGLNALTVDGKLYGVPIYQTASAPMINKKAFADAGIDELPDTWDEVKAAAPKLAEKGIAVMAYYGAPEETLNLTFYPLLWAHGGSVFAPDGKSVAFNGPEGVAALQYLLDLKAAGGLPGNAATLGSAVEGGPLATGKAAMTHAGAPAFAEQLGKAIGAENLEIGLPFAAAKRVTFGIPGGLMLAKHSPNMAAAKKFAGYLASAEVAADLAQASGYFPARTDAKVEGQSEIAKRFEPALEFVYPGDAHPKARQVMSALIPHLQAALQGKKSAKQALDDAAKEADGALSSGG